MNDMWQCLGHWSVAAALAGAFAVVWGVVWLVGHLL